jgi:hypothetical protein
VPIYFINGYWFGGYYIGGYSIMAISNYSIGGYLKLNYHRLFMVIHGAIFLMAIGGYW